MKMNCNLWMASTALMLSFAAPALAQEADVPVEGAEAQPAAEEQAITVIGTNDIDRDRPVNVSPGFAA